MVTNGVANNADYAETWFHNDSGTKARPRPTAIPLDRTGVEVYRPNEFGATDLAGEFLHVDPYSHFIRQRLMQSFTPDQVERLKHIALDYQDTLNQGGDDAQAMRNATDSALRGYTVGQWSDRANRDMGYTPQQMGLLDALRHYMTTGRQ